MKSLAREGDSEAGAIAGRTAVPPAATALSPALTAVAVLSVPTGYSSVTGSATGAVSLPQSAAAPSVLVSMTTDLTAHH